MAKRKILPYNPKLKKIARNLRKQGILSEVLLWKELKGKKLGYDFHRQKPIDEYVVDFYCADLDLIIEIDGSSHNAKYEKDIERQQKLESFGLQFLRFYDGDVRFNLEGVVQSIKDWIITHPVTAFSGATPLKRGIKTDIK